MNQILRTFAIATALAAPLAAQVTQRVSVSSSGAQANDGSVVPAISADGRYVVFLSDASNLVAGDTNSLMDLFLRDRLSGTTERVNVASDGTQANDDNFSYLGHATISADGRYVAFASSTTNLVAGDTNGTTDIFVRDRQSGTTERVSVDSAGAQASGGSGHPSISADGRYVVFESWATNLAPGDTNNWEDIFVRDRQNGTTERVSVDSSGAEATNASDLPSISSDGRYVVFQSWATNLVAGDTNERQDVFVRDRQTGTTERVSVDSSGTQANDWSEPGTISADGRFVAFQSFATNLVPGDTNGEFDVFVRDRQSGTTERVNVDSSGAQANDGGSSGFALISDDGRYVAFISGATNLVAGDTNDLYDVFVRDRQSGTTERVNLNWAGEQSGPTDHPAFSSDGRYVAFTGYAPFVFEDSTFAPDIYVRDRFGGTSFTSLCDPGTGGVIACPCANPPSGPGRGCNNSAATGGAVLSAAGGPYLSSDSLVFTTSGEKPTATSVVLQGTSSPASGVVYGQGVRCVGGILKRLYTKTASGGSITAPNYFAGDPEVSVRSAAKGSPISAGQSRWYLVFYRDPIVLGGCPGTSTFNATQTGEIAWSP